MTASDTGYAAYKSRTRFGNLDGLRFICIAMVLWHHAPALDSDVLALFGRGFFGVDFFFVLSGYLITTLLLRESEAKGQFSMRNFYIRRALRIIPVYFFVVTCVALYFIGVKGETQYLSILPYYYLFLSNFLIEDIPLLGITWSLSVEEQYYLIWPLLLMLLPSRMLVPACVVLIGANVLNALGVFGIAAIPLGPLLIAPPTATYAPIIMGSLAAVLLHQAHGFAWLKALAGWRGAAIVGFMALVALLQFSPADVRGLPNFAIHSVMTFILVALVVRERTALTPILANAAVARVGAVSYGIYLYHLIALDIVTRVSGGANPWVILIGYCVVSYVLAELSFRTLEAYFQRFRPKS